MTCPTNLPEMRSELTSGRRGESLRSEVGPQQAIVEQTSSSVAALMEDSKYTILLVDDDENDVLLMRMAFDKSNLPNTIQWARDGAEAIAYLNGEGAYANRQLHPFPEVLIVDLKMPRMTGIELLTWIRDHPEYRVIPTIILTSSRLDADIQAAYNLGANTYMIKPASLENLAKMVKAVHDYWALSVKPKTNREKNS